MQEKNSQFSDLQRLITEWKLNKVVLASKMKMNAYTFKMKIAGNNPSYNFTDSELQKLTDVLKELAESIEVVCGISFNKALANIARKKV